MKYIFVIFVVMVFVVQMNSYCYSQADPTELHYSIIQNTGLNGIHLPEVSLPDSTYNPAALPSISDYGFKGSASVLSGNMGVDNGNVSFGTVSYSDKIGKFYFRLSLFQTDSSSMKFLDSSSLAGLDSSFHIKATEFSVAYPLAKNLSVGGSWIINEESNFYLKTIETNLPLYSSNSSADANFRLGVQYKPIKNITIASVYGQRHDVFNTTLYPMITGQDFNIFQKTDYYTRMWTHGISYQLGPTTSIFYDHQFMNWSSLAGNLDYNLSYYGIMQNLNKNFYIKAASLDGAPEFQLNYINQNFYMGGYYSEGSKPLEPLVGKPKRLIFWMGINF